MLGRIHLITTGIRWLKGIITFMETIRNLLNNFEKFKHNVRRIRSAARRAQLCTFLLFILTNEQRKSYEVLWGWVHTSQVGLQKADIVCKYLGTRTYVDRADRILELDINFLVHWGIILSQNFIDSSQNSKSGESSKMAGLVFQGQLRGQNHLSTCWE